MPDMYGGLPAGSAALRSPRRGLWFTALALAMGSIVAFFVLWAPPSEEHSARSGVGAIEHQGAIERSPVRAERGPQARVETVEGRVEDSVDGTVIAGATIGAIASVCELVPTETIPLAVSDVLGRFVLALDGFSLTGEHAGLCVRANGYVPTFVSSRRLLDAAPLVVTLNRGVSIAGHVVDDRGDPLPGVRVQAFGRGSAGAVTLNAYLGWQSARATRGEVQTNADGFFEIQGLDAGPIRLRVTKVGWRERPSSDKNAHLNPKTSLPLATDYTHVVHTGDVGIRVIMEPVWILLTEVVDANTGVALPFSRVSTLLPSALAEPSGTEMIGVDDRSWPPPARAAHSDKLHRSYWSVSATKGSPDAVMIRAESLGYERATTHLVPRGPDDPLYLEAQQVPLKRANEVGEGTVHLRVRIANAAYGGSVYVLAMQSGIRGTSLIYLPSVKDDEPHEIRLSAGEYQFALNGIPPYPSFVWPWQRAAITAGVITHAQLDCDGGFVSIVVDDASGMALPEAVVRLTSCDEVARSWLLFPYEAACLEAPGFARAFNCIVPGNYRVLVPAGQYRVRVGCLGYGDAFVPSCAATSGATTELRVTLSQ